MGEAGWSRGEVTDALEGGYAGWCGDAMVLELRATMGIGRSRIWMELYIPWYGGVYVVMVDGGGFGVVHEFATP